MEAPPHKTKGFKLSDRGPFSVPWQLRAVSDSQWDLHWWDLCQDDPWMLDLIRLWEIWRPDDNLSSLVPLAILEPFFAVCQDALSYLGCHCHQGMLLPWAGVLGLQQYLVGGLCWVAATWMLGPKVSQQNIALLQDYQCYSFPIGFNFVAGHCELLWIVS